MLHGPFCSCGAHAAMTVFSTAGQERCYSSNSVPELVWHTSTLAPFHLVPAVTAQQINRTRQAGRCRSIKHTESLCNAYATAIWRLKCKASHQVPAVTAGQSVRLGPACLALRHLRHP
jgi:hypothetical protein